MNTLWQDLRYAARMLMKHPGFTAVAVVTLALGAGANTAIFSLVNAVLLKPLPYLEPERLVQLWETDSKGGWNHLRVSVRDYLDWKSQNRVFEQIAAYRGGTFTVTGNGDPEQLRGQYAPASLFSLLGVRPMLGRVFLPEEEKRSGPKIVMVSHGLWRRRFGADPSLIGQAISLNGNAWTVVGIMPPDFEFPIQSTKTDVWMPLVFQPAELEGTSRFLSVIGRLGSGIKLRQAQTEMNAIARLLEQQRPDRNAGIGARVVALHDEIVGDSSAALLTLLGAVGVVLLIACSNVANLLLARAAIRQKEIAVRVALGGGRLRLIRQLLTEGVLLAVVGGALGLMLAVWTVDFLVAISPVNLPRVEKIGIDAQVLAFTLAISLLTGLVFSLVPALQASNPDLNEVLKEGGLQMTSSKGGWRIRNLLVIAETALALVLLVSAGLMIKSFVRLYRVDPGINPKNVLTASISLSPAQYREPHQQVAFYQQVLERLKALPEVEAAGLASGIPLSGGAITYSFTIAGRPPNVPGESRSAGYYVLSPDSFRVLGIPILEGRGFTGHDSETSPKVVVINQAMARKFFPGEKPLGQRLIIEGDSQPSEIVGVAGDTRRLRLESAPMEEMYVPYTQVHFLRFLSLVVRTTSDPMRLVAPVRKQVLAVNPDQPLSNIQTMEQYFAASIAPARFRGILLGLFAAMALALAAVGLYGVMSYTVAQRTHEIGIRMALGASALDVLKHVVGRGLLLTLAGVALGLAASLAVTRVLSGLLYQVQPTDPLTFALLSLLMVSVALAACYIPARRAMKVDPMVALRYE